MDRFFKLREHGTKVSTEVLAGITTFFTMAYIIAVNPSILAQSGMPWGAVFLATIIAAIIGTLVMGLFANVPYAQAPGMGLNAFFVFTVCFTLKFTWQQALSMVFLCGVINILITVTKVRKHIIRAIPKSLQNAISGGIGVFIAYIGLLNAGLINFGADVPSIPALNQPILWVFLIGLFLIIVLSVMKVKGAILISIIATAIIGIPFGVTKLGETINFSEAASQLPKTFGVIFTAEGLPSLFTDLGRLPLVLMTIFAFSLTDTFDTIGTFIGTGCRAASSLRRTSARWKRAKASLQDGQGPLRGRDGDSVGALWHQQHHHLCGIGRRIQAVGAPVSPSGAALLFAASAFLASGIGYPLPLPPRRL